MKPILIILAALAFNAASLPAQVSDKPVPQAPYLAEVPDYGHWVVTFKYEGAAPVPTDGDGNPAATPAPVSKVSSGLPATIDTIKTGELRGIVVTFGDGAARQYTCQGDWVLSSTAKGPQLLPASSLQRPYPYYTSGFILLEGVSLNPSLFKGAEMYKGALAFHYQSGNADIWIDIKSMLPLMVKTSDVEASYQFLPAPPKPFVIPDEQAALLKKEQEADKKARALR